MISTSKSSAKAGPTGSDSGSGCGAGAGAGPGSGSASGVSGPGNSDPNGGSNAAPSSPGGGINLQTSISNPNSPTPTTAVVFTAGGATYTANSASNFVIGGSTLTLGGTVILSTPGSSSPTTYILPSNPTAIIINGATQALQKAALTSAATHLLVLGSSTYTENSTSGFQIGSQTLTPGGIITAAGDTISLSPNGATAILISGTSTSTQALQILTPAASPHIIVIGSSTYTENSASQYVIGGQTLTEGGVITASGETVSLETGGASVVVASGKSTLTQAPGSVAPSPTGAAQATSTKSAGAKMVPCLMGIWVVGSSMLAGLL